MADDDYLNLLYDEDGELNAYFEGDMADKIADEFFIGINTAIRSMLGYLGSGAGSQNAALMDSDDLRRANYEEGSLRGISETGEDWYLYSVQYGSDLLYRPSLSPNKYDGLNDVVAAFSVGWNIQAKKVPHGLWQSRGKWVYALRHREGNGAILAFVEEFENKYPMVKVSLPAEWGRD